MWWKQLELSGSTVDLGQVTVLLTIALNINGPLSLPKALQVEASVISFVIVSAF